MTNNLGIKAVNALTKNEVEFLVGGLRYYFKDRTIHAGMLPFLSRTKVGKLYQVGCTCGNTNCTMDLNIAHKLGFNPKSQLNGKST